jgi:type VI secretion system protein ImpA
MATPPTLDIPSLLTPVSDEQPAGPELRHDPDREVARIYLSVRDARKKAIDAERRLRDFALMTEEERRGYPEPPLPPDWNAVRKYAVDALTRSKDLWVTAWLIEALTRVDGFAGLRDGVTLAHQLCERFWDSIHPQVTQEQSLTNRFAQLAGLDGGSTSEGTLLAPVSRVPLTAARTFDDFSLADYRDAVELDRRPPAIRTSRIEQGAPTLDLFAKAVAETSASSFQRLIEDLEGALNALGDFQRYLREREEAHRAAGGHAFVPAMSNIREALEECLRLCRASAKDALKDGAPAVQAVTHNPHSEVSTMTSAEENVAGLSVATREEAFRTLLQVSDYFRRTEPHSPISYALEQAVRWGRMSLPELLSELVSDKSTREEIFRRAGITQEPEE